MVGSGTLITFPTLLALGVPPVLANVSNTRRAGPGLAVGGARAGRSWSGQRDRMIRLGAASLIGGVIGALLLLRLPAAAFDAIVPILIGLGCVLVIIGRRAVAADRRAARAARRRRGARPRAGLAVVRDLATGVYGGYFGAAQGVLLIAILGIGLTDPLPRINALKNVLAGIANGVAGVRSSSLISEVNWWAAARSPSGRSSAPRSARGSGAGCRRSVYRVVIVVVGVVAIIILPALTASHFAPGP